MPITLGNTSITSSTGTVDTSNNLHVTGINGVIGIGAAALGYGNVAAFGRASTAGFHINGSAVGDLCIGAEFGKSVLIGTGASGALERRMQIDGSGRVTKPFQPAFYARRTSGYGSSGVTPFDDISLNVGSHFSGTRFTAPVAGVYYATGSWLPNSNAGSNGWIQKNGTRVSANAYNFASDNHATATVIVYLAASDYLEFFINADGTEGIYCHFGAYLIG
jgi:hypothetical protein